MKFLVTVAILLLCIVSSLQLQLFENCPPEHLAFSTKNDLICGKTTCLEDGTFTTIGCGTYACENQIGFKEEDNSKVYPACCGGPICDGDEAA